MGAGERVRVWVAAAVLLLCSQAPQAGGATQTSAPLPLKKTGYFVWSPSCKIPYVDPYDTSIHPFLKRVRPIVCSDRKPLTYVTSLDQGHVLRVDADVEPQYVRQGYRLTCCYSSVSARLASLAWSNFKSGKCEVFAKEVQLKPTEEFIHVRCIVRKSYNRYNIIYSKEEIEVYVNMHAIVPIKPIVAEKRRKRKSPDDDSWFNVLIVGYDSISRLNLLRTMPKTVTYLKRVGYVDMQGYNKIGYGTAPNVMGFLTGMSPQQVVEKWNKSGVDDSPFVWKDFKKHNYVTVYGQDIHNNIRFLNQPLDYCFPADILVGKMNLPVRRRDYSNLCLGPISAADHMFDYALRFVAAFKNYFYFAYFWLNNFSHNDLNSPRAMDVKTLKFFQRLAETDTYNNTIIVFVSDHGMSFDGIRQTHIGWFESRSPFVYIFLPDLFKKKYHEAYQNLQRNRNRLTSPFDLYVTLKDVLARGMNSTIARRNVSLGCPKCKSLFSEDFGDRSCHDAGISREWCTCTDYNYRNLPVKNVVVQNAAKFVVSQIQNKIRNSLEAKGCAQLLMHRVLTAKQKVNGKYEGDYFVVFETQPGGGCFEATVRHSKGSDFSLLGMVERVNAYGNDSFCVTDRDLKLYCFCLG